MLVEKPWERVKLPTAIPDGDLLSVLPGLDDQSFAQLIRSNLVPRDASPDSRHSWQELWIALDQDDVLVDRTFDVLDELLDATAAAADDPALAKHELRRVAKLRRFCDDAWKRLQGPDRPLQVGEPLAWAGRAGAGFNRPARHVIQQLVDAIAEHRTASPLEPSARDVQLWAVLRRVGLDPDRIRR